MVLLLIYVYTYISTFAASLLRQQFMKFENGSTMEDVKVCRKEMQALCHLKGIDRGKRTAQRD